LVTFQPKARNSLFTLARLKNLLEASLCTSVDLVEDHAGLDAVVRIAIAKNLRPALLTLCQENSTACSWSTLT